MVTPADMTERDAARELLWRLRLTHARITQVWSGSAYAGQLVDWADDLLHITLRTVSRPKGTKGFVVFPAAGSSNGPSAGSCTPAAMFAATNASHSTPKPT
jgi:hypothetical protein